MPIPKEILAVERPTNTVVYAYGKNRDRYGVRKRVGCRRVDGRNLPINGPTVGHIVGGRYVPLPDPAEAVAVIAPVSRGPVDLKDWGDVRLCEYVSGDIYADLLMDYNEHDANTVMCIAILRVVHPGIKDCELKDAYDESFLSIDIPGTALSRNTVSRFENDLGRTCSRIRTFMRRRADRVGVDHHVLLDGTLKSDESKVNSLSEFSRKARTKGTRDINVVWAYDLTEDDLVCSKCYPGNTPDCNAYDDFVEENGIRRGLIVGDKGFPSSMIAGRVRENPDLHYLNPLKRNSGFYKTHDLLDWEGILPGHEGVTYRKEKVRGKDKWLYSFRDERKAAAEEHKYLRNARKNKTFDNANFKRKQAKFGTILLECDLDLPPVTAYKAYDERWEIELVMRFYKDTLELDETRVHDDYSVIGSEFINFLSSVITRRLIKRFDGAGLLERDTYKGVTHKLAKAKMARRDDGDWELVSLIPSNYRLLEELGLVAETKPGGSGESVA